jgi:hypothetical protein
MPPLAGDQRHRWDTGFEAVRQQAELLEESARVTADGISRLRSSPVGVAREIGMAWVLTLPAAATNAALHLLSRLLAPVRAACGTTGPTSKQLYSEGASDTAAKPDHWAAPKYLPDHARCSRCALDRGRSSSQIRSPYQILAPDHT